MEKVVNDTLYIPVNIKTRYEFFEGYGMSELVWSAIVTVIAGIIAFGINIITGNVVVCVLIVLVAMAGSVMALSKGPNNQSMVDQIRLFYHFVNSQQKFPYNYKNEWGE